MKIVNLLFLKKEKFLKQINRQPISRYKNKINKN